MTRFAQALFLTLLAALFPASAVAQNLLVNGNFDTDVSSWVKISSTGTAVFSPLDADGSASSGSMLTTNTESTLFVHQCRPATAGTSYDFGGKARVPLGQVAGQYLQQLNFFTNTTCTGSGRPSQSTQVRRMSWRSTQCCRAPRKAYFELLAQPAMMMP